VAGLRASPLEALVGQTPLVRLEAFEPRRGVEFYAKLESRNPGGSVKDRAALAIVREAERSGRLGPGVTLLDATSGNTGIAYAMLGAAKGFPVTLCLPAGASEERKRILRAYGAELVITDSAEGSDGAIRRARELYAENPRSFFYADQYNNPANPRAHYETTAPEIWAQTRGTLTHFVAGLGTSGTLMGAGRRLRELKPGVRLVAVQPDSPMHGLEGLKHMPTAIVPGIYDPNLHDELVEVETEEAQTGVRRLAREAGLLVGVSSGAALVASMRVADELTKGVIVMVFPDGGDRYLSERFWDAPSS
jgi:S-sulfo-L-cysteine synthase (O-acetyl-L-serine-dependent)